jgi:hypothetical protein
MPNKEIKVYLPDEYSVNENNEVIDSNGSKVSLSIKREGFFSRFNPIPFF